MSAKKPPRLAGLGRRKKLVVVCLAIVCALIAVGLYAWQSQPVPEAGASVTTAEGKSRQEIQDELDAIVRDNMMTISVAPVAQLQEGGKLRVNVQNVQDNKFPQRFRVIQNDETIYESGVVEAGKTVETCPAGDIQEGEAYIEIQALDAKTYDTHGNVRDNMMTISVAPVAQLQEGGKLRVNVQNVQDNKFPQRFRVIQNDETIYESGVVEAGKTVETCPAGDIQEGEAYIEIQALDAKTYDTHGNPTRVKVRVAQAEG